MLSELSIIVPTLNEEKYLPKLLKSIVEQNFQGKLQVIIVDGNSEDDTLLVAQSFKNHFDDLQILQTKRGIAFQRNSGVKKAKYDHLLFVDADVILQKNFLHKLSHKITNQTNFIYAFFLWPADFDIPDYLTMIPLYVIFVPLSLLKKVTPGGLMFTSREVYERINGFKESLLLAEDLDFGRRAVESGAKYRLFFGISALHSTRRLRKMGRINFFLLYIKAYFYEKRYGLESFQEKMTYPFGHYND